MNKEQAYKPTKKSVNNLFSTQFLKIIFSVIFTAGFAMNVFITNPAHALSKPVAPPAAPDQIQIEVDKITTVEAAELELDRAEKARDSYRVSARQASYGIYGDSEEEKQKNFEAAQNLAAEQEYKIKLLRQRIAKLQAEANATPP